MATNNNADQGTWSEGLSQINEAVSHSLTASRLATAGMVALGAAATAYLWDTSRRNAFLDSMRGMPNPFSSLWGSSSEQSGKSG